MLTTFVAGLALATVVVACKHEPRPSAGSAASQPADRARTPSSAASKPTTLATTPATTPATTGLGPGPGQCGGDPSKPACTAAKAVDVPKCDRAAMRAATLKDGKDVLAGIKLKASSAQADLIAGADLYDGKTVQIEGPVIAICPGQGCWVALRGPQGKRLNLKVDDGVVDFRKVARIGAYAIGEGVFKKLGHHGMQVKLTGARVSATLCK